MQTLPDEMVWWQVKDAIDRGVPNTLVAFYGTQLQLYQYMKGLGEYLAKKGYMVKLHEHRRHLTVYNPGGRSSKVSFSYFVSEDDSRDAELWAGCEFQFMVTNILLTFDANHRNKPITYLMSRIRKAYEEK